ncbi:MAG: hypothetical protein Q9222_003897 [Ikaeria aurantiellina]
MPERSSLAAWKQSQYDYKGVAMSGYLRFAEGSNSQIFDFVLNPLRLEPTYRFARKFGHDRFFVLSIPDLELKQLPPHLRSDPDARKAIIQWLVQSEHCFLGRKWRALYIKPESNRKGCASSHNRLQGSRYRVYLFAVSGSDTEPGGRSGERDPRRFNHPTVTIKQLVEWFMPMKENRNQKALKFFARLAIAAAQAISGTLGLDHIPSIFQGRVAGAKGVWMVDCLDETIGGLNGDSWIEITDSQLKFEASAGDALYPDPERVTFEVHSYSRPLSSASLNFQLMPILAERKVPFLVFQDLLEADLSSKVAELEGAMESGLAIRKWNQEVNSIVSERSLNGVEWHGGLPVSLPEKINWFVEHGFEPSNCCRLKDLLYLAIAGYCLRLENRMNIGVAKSTYAFMIADPLVILEEDEVHLGFSRPFDQELMLHNINLLVARLPAALPSDIQKVRAVFKLELKNYRDVIVFPSRGSLSLATKLSGGDYDGDKAWVCWEPSVVDPFQNAPLQETPSLESHDIKSDPKTVGDFFEHEDYVDHFLHYSFDFNLQSNLLGICTSYFDSLCYFKNDISHPSAIKIAQLLGHLVDRAKSGVMFDNDKWDAFLASEGLPRHLPKPAYKDKEKGTPKSDNLIDHLVFKVAKGVREKALGDFSRRFKGVGTYDIDLVRIYKAESEEAKNDKGIAQVLKGLKSGLQEIKDYWSLHCMRGDDLANEEHATSIRGRRKSIIPFQAVADRVREDFLALRPGDEAIKLSPIVARWDREHASIATMGGAQPNHWTLLKASTAFSHFHNTTFIWYCCGIELGFLKAQAKGCRNVVDPIWECMKVDGRVVRRKMDGEAREDGYVGGLGALIDGEGGEVGEDEYGDWGWVDVVDDAVR